MIEKFAIRWIVQPSYNRPQVTSKKVLGRTIHEEVKWNENNDNQCMYNSLVLPHITYCSNVWVYKLQKKNGPNNYRI